MIRPLSLIPCTVLFALLISSTSLAQELPNTTYIGLGAGTTTFFGDVGTQNEGYSPFLGRPGFHLTLSNPVTPYLEGGLEAMFGTISANERGVNRNLNFRSEIRSGGLFMAYNFNHFLNEDRKASPILSLGLSGFEFLSKSDLYDAEGRKYHYWQDGTIRDIDEFAENAEEASIIYRDHKYESDLRELDLDGFGDYSERGLAIPVGIGAQFEMGKYLNLSIHSRYYFTSTDYIDNVTDESRGNRAGNGSNDRFLYTGFVLKYGLHKRNELLDSDLDAELLAGLTDRSDEDNDGVVDIADQCPHTPKDVEVDANGRPLDGDADGVPDYMDLELNTPDSAFVDANGVSLDDNYFEEGLAKYLGTGEANVVEGTIESASIPKPVFTPRPGKKFMVQVGETAEGISSDLATLLLSIPDVQTISKGDTVLYMVGDYDNLPDAVQRQLQLSGEGIDGSVVSAEDGVVTDQSAEAEKIQNEVQENFDPANELGEEALFWRVQVGAFRYKLSRNIFSSLNDIVTIYGEDGLTRYFSGVYTERSDAEKYRDILQNSGYNDAFLAAFRNGEKINVVEAMGGGNMATSDELWNRATPDGFDENLIRYKIVLAESDGMLEAGKLEQLREIGSISQFSSNGKTLYLTGDFGQMDEAQQQVNDIHNSGLGEAHVIGIFNGEILTLEDIESMKKN